MLYVEFFQVTNSLTLLIFLIYTESVYSGVYEENIIQTVLVYPSLSKLTLESPELIDDEDGVSTQLG